MSTDFETIDPDEAGCRLYLIGPPHPELEGFAARLDRALAAGGSAAFLFRGEGERRQVAAAALALRELCRAREVAFLIQDAFDLAIECGADGVHLTSPEQVGNARQRLGPEQILGVSCGVSRHYAMTAGENGADYVAFGDPERPVNDKLIDMVSWWSEVFVLPCLALGAIDAQSCPTLVRAGADFLAVSDAVWHHPDGPAAAVRALQEAIAQAHSKSARTL